MSKHKFSDTHYQRTNKKSQVFIGRYVIHNIEVMYMLLALEEMGFIFFDPIKLPSYQDSEPKWEIMTWADKDE